MLITNNEPDQMELFSSSMSKIDWNKGRKKGKGELMDEPQSEMAKVDRALPDLYTNRETERY